MNANRIPPIDQAVSSDLAQATLLYKPSLTSLPTEVRHRIYRELFCRGQQPLVLARRRPGLPGVERHSVFYTAFFRVNRQLHDDAVTFAYSFNSFQVRQDFDVLCGLSHKARSSIRHLTVYPTMWCSERNKEAEMWTGMAQFTSLQRVEIWLHSETLYPAIPYLHELRQVLSERKQRPYIALELCVWEKHLSFDHSLDHERNRKLILQGYAEPKEEYTTAISPRQRILRLPTHAAQIVLTGDISATAAKALDEYLMSLDRCLLTKSVMPLPKDAVRYNGRSQRLWYELQLE